MEKTAVKKVKLKEAAELIGVSPNTLRNWDRSGKLRAVRDPKNKYRYYRLSDITPNDETKSQPTLPTVESTPSTKTAPQKNQIDVVALKRILRQMNRAFRDSHGGSLLERFDEISKIIFCKLFDERTSERGRPHRFLCAANESTEKTYARITDLFSDACGEYVGLFENARQHLTADKHALCECVRLLQDAELSKAPIDVKGIAYEELIKDTFDKNDNQQFFTPRTVVDFMVDALAPKRGEKICDPACGSGGFLIAASEFLHSNFGESAGAELRGAEIDSRMAWVAQMNLLMHGASKGRVSLLRNGGSLGLSEQNLKELPDDYFDIVITNPPFGSDFSEAEHLSKYQLGKDRASRRRGVLFVERCLRMLKPGGRMAIILDDSILSGSNNDDVRNLVLSQAVLRGVISLPDAAFMPYATVKASILILEKKRTPKVAAPSVFMAAADNVGRRPNGDPQFSETRDANGQPLLDNDLVIILDKWRIYQGKNVSFEESPPHVFECPTKDVLEKNRFDPLFYHPWRSRADEALATSSNPICSLGDLIEERNVSLVPNIEVPDENCRYIGLSNIKALTGEYEISEVRGDNLKSAVRLFRAGDIIFSKLRPELRKCSLIGESEEDGHVSSECFVFTPRKDVRIKGEIRKIDPSYLAIMLRSDLVFGQIIYQCTGLGRPRVNKAAIMSLQIPIPPTSKQVEIVKLYEQKWARCVRLHEESAEAARRADHLLRDTIQSLQLQVL